MSRPSEISTDYVRDVSISINSLALKFLGVTFADSTNTTALEDDTAVLLHDSAREVLERLNLALLALFLLERFSLADDLAAVVVYPAVLVASTSCAVFGTAFDETTDDGAVIVDDVAGFVALESLEGRVV